VAGIAFAPRAWQALGVAAVVAALPTLFCWVRNDSNGALDNATGVCAVLLAAQSVSDVADIGVLLTSGEELGLAGARAWGARASREITVVNCDTFDDIGSWRCMHTGRRPGSLSATVETSASRLGFKVSTGRMIPGILADSIAFSDLGINAVTLSRGTLSTLARIHTRRDNSAVLTGKGVADASRLLSDLVRQLV
jgi:Zn-dependent M28 family amino/carboxypeptidase